MCWVNTRFDRVRFKEYTQFGSEVASIFEDQASIVKYLHQNVCGKFEMTERNIKFCGKVHKCAAQKHLWIESNGHSNILLAKISCNFRFRMKFCVDSRRCLFIPQPNYSWVVYAQTTMCMCRMRTQAVINALNISICSVFKRIMLIGEPSKLLFFPSIQNCFNYEIPASVFDYSFSENMLNRAYNDSINLIVWWMGLQ